ncbi:F-box protein DOR [Raphanus sativus]|uniref:F-box protein DOR n=1 Tax=Raphanus sativus TaxID=3726 RepID=A0A6J0NXM8_RAPSA|nr:F-box protein DOR [Raphanus sativus]KAJ4892913.1 F-box protein DOR [Raphanus sativus]
MKLRQRKDRNPHSSSLPPLPIELVIDIFSRLSLKSIAFCRCVSKPWASVLGRSDFRDLRLTRSQATPRLLFAFWEGNKLFFLSSPQPQSPDDDMSVVAADHHVSFSFDHPVKAIFASVNGFVCVRIKGHRFVKGKRYKVDESVMCNPSTGQSFTIPRMKTRTRVVGIVRFLGYDPVEKLHKVLGMVRGHRSRTMDHQVLTLGGGTEKATTWRMTECIPCVSSKLRENICINGVLYYIEADPDWSGDHMIICFDVRSEKYSFVKPPKRELHHKLLDCNGKLALVPMGKSYSFNSETVKMWVLEDPERHEWSKRVYIFTPMWKNVVDRLRSFEIVGVTGPNEFLMSSTYSSEPFQVYYCNFDKETVTRVVIQGVGALRDGRGYSIHTCLNHVEDVKLMEL